MADWWIEEDGVRASTCGADALRRPGHWQSFDPDVAVGTAAEGDPGCRRFRRGQRWLGSTACSKWGRGCECPRTRSGRVGPLERHAAGEYSRRSDNGRGAGASASGGMRWGPAWLCWQPRSRCGRQHHGMMGTAGTGGQPRDARGLSGWCDRRRIIGRKPGAKE
jgi:hypothetical protein